MSKFWGIKLKQLRSIIIITIIFRHVSVSGVEGWLATFLQMSRCFVLLQGRGQNTLFVGDYSPSQGERGSGSASLYSGSLGTMPQWGSGAKPESSLKTKWASAAQEFIDDEQNTDSAGAETFVEYQSRRAKLKLRRPRATRSTKTTASTAD